MTKTFTVGVANVTPEKTKGSGFADVIVGGSGRTASAAAPATTGSTAASPPTRFRGAPARTCSCSGRSSTRRRTSTRSAISLRATNLHLDNAIFKALGAGTPAKPRQARGEGVLHGKAAHDADDRIVYDKASGALSYDRDGSGSAAPVLFAKLLNKAALTAADFFVI